MRWPRFKFWLLSFQFVWFGAVCLASLYFSLPICTRGGEFLSHRVLLRMKWVSTPKALKCHLANVNIDEVLTTIIKASLFFSPQPCWDCFQQRWSVCACPAPLPLGHVRWAQSCAPRLAEALVTTCFKAARPYLTPMHPGTSASFPAGQVLHALHLAAPLKTRWFKLGAICNCFRDDFPSSCFLFASQRRTGQR